MSSSYKISAENSDIFRSTYVDEFSKVDTNSYNLNETNNKFKSNFCPILQ